MDVTPRPVAVPGQATTWQTATVSAIRVETPRAKSFWLELPNWQAHLPGQYYSLRLTAPDGYQAVRSYSIASSPLDTARSS